jgi:DNA-binding beta-propeller fold protein YncE
MAAEDETPSPARELLLDSGKAGAAGLLTEAERKRRRRKIAALLAILAALAIIILIILRSLSGNSPLPGIPTELPHYVSDIYGTNAPMGVAVSPAGDRVYVTESEGRRLVRVYDSSGNQVDALEPPGHRGKWSLPVYVAVSPLNGDVYVSDRLREALDVYDAEGKYLRTMRPKGRLGKGANPLGLAFGPEGRLYMTDVSGNRKKHRVLVFGSGERPLRKIGSRGSFWFPNGLTLDGDGDLYVADSNDGRLAIFDPDGKLVSSIQRGVGEGDLGLPRGVALDGDGRLFVVDTTAHAVKVYRLPDEVTEVPRYVGSFGIEGMGDGQFQYPNGIAVDGNGRIYVTDRENDRVQIWSY